MRRSAERTGLAVLAGEIHCDQRTKARGQPNANGTACPVSARRRLLEDGGERLQPCIPALLPSSSGTTAT